MMTASDLKLAAVARPRSAAWYAWNFGSERAARIWQLYYHRREFVCVWRKPLSDSCRAFPADAAEARRGITVSTALRTGNGFTGHPPVTPAVRLDAQKAAGQVPDSFLFMNRYRVGPAYMACLDRMLVRAARQNVPVLIVDMPVPADLDQRIYPTRIRSLPKRPGRGGRGPRRAAAPCHAVRRWTDRRGLQRPHPPQRQRRRQIEYVAANGGDRRRGGYAVNFASKAFFIFLPIVLLGYHLARTRTIKYRWLLNASWVST